jgi:hypothetical protein
MRARLAAQYNPNLMLLNYGAGHLDIRIFFMLPSNSSFRKSSGAENLSRKPPDGLVDRLQYFDQSDSGCWQSVLRPGRYDPAGTIERSVLSRVAANTLSEERGK